MKKRILSTILVLVLCLSLVPSAFAAHEAPDYLLPETGYLQIMGVNSKIPPRTADKVGDTVTYKLVLRMQDYCEDDFLIEELYPDTPVTIEQLNEEGNPIKILYSGTGEIATWTPDTLGLYRLRITVEEYDYTYSAEEFCWVGKPFDIAQTAYLTINRYGNEKGVVYTGKSIAEEITIYSILTEKAMVKGTDYKIKISGGKSAGHCTVTVTGIGKYTGVLKEEFEIINFAAKYKDVKKNGWYIGAINFALSQGLFNGTSKTTFEPDTAMTRGMFVTVIGRLLGWDSLQNANSGFVDVPADEYYSKYVAYAAYTNIVTGVDRYHFAPNAPITREQICTMILRVNEYMESVLSRGQDEDVFIHMSYNYSKFTDHSQISDYALEAVAACRGSKIVSGEKVAGGYRFRPQGKATRAEVATILQNYIAFLTKKIEKLDLK